MAATRKVASAARRNGMDVRDAPPEQQRVYASQLRRMAKAIERDEGLDPAAVSSMILMNALLQCDTQQDTEALIGEPVEDTPAGMARVFIRYAEILEGWADAKSSSTEGEA